MVHSMEVSHAPNDPMSGVPAAMVEIVNGDYRCHPCVAICNNRQMLEAHLSGKKHVAKIALCGGTTAFQPLSDLPDLPPRESQTLTPAGRKRKNVSAQGSFRCEICEIDFGSAFPFESHMQGKKHMNKVQKREQGDTPTTLSCEICSVSTPDKNAYDAHVNGKKHLAKVAKLENGSKVPAETFHCEFCNVSVNNKDIFESHRNGKKHAEKVRKIAEGDAGAKESFSCGVCSVTVTAQSLLDAHLMGKKHLKMVADGGKPKSEGEPNQFRCDLCNVLATCQATLDMHFNGKKHQKMANPDGVEPPAKAAVASPSKKKEKAAVDLSAYFCNICGLQLNGPAIMESHLAGKAHKKKMSALNEQNASALATSFVKSVREETDNGSMMDMDRSTKAENPVAQPQAAAPIDQEQPATPIPALIPAHTTDPAVTASPGRSRSRRAN